MDTLEPIAVIGGACRFPGARDLEEFWQNLVSGRDAFTFFSETELRRAGVSESALANPEYVRAGVAMPGIDLFDAGLFRMTPREAELCDPQLRGFLEIAHGAIEHAGYDPFAIRDTVGVFGSVGPNGYLAQNLSRRPDLVGPSGMLAQTLNQADYLATFVAYKLNFKGPAVTVLTACSSTLVAVHLASQALRLGECDVGIAGGSVVRLPLGHGYHAAPGGVWSADGYCRPFDAAGSGTVFGSGAGAVVLKRLDDAIVDGDHIKAVLLGSAINNDGAEKVSFSAPSVGGQVAAIQEAMTLAEVVPAEVGHVEAHATGTTLGDPVEVAALAEAYAQLAPDPLPSGSCLLGSVKSNIGHMDAVAGIAGFLKTMLMLDREAIPPTLHAETVNPRLELEKTPFALATTLRPWRREPDRRRVAGVTSLGVGGTNAHAILAEAPLPEYDPATGQPRVLVWSAGSSAGETQLRSELATWFGARDDDVFPDAVATLAHGRTAHAVRGAVVCDSAAAAAEALSGQADGARIFTAQSRPEPAVAYVFPGQGAQHQGMASGLYGTVRAFTLAMDECLELFEQSGTRLYDAWTGRDPAALTDPELAQPLLFSVEYALAEMWRQWGAPPTAVLGHSLGELTAAAVAGCFSLPDAVRMVQSRAAAMAAHPVPGGMLAVAATEDELRPYLTEALAVAAVNGHRQVVVSGPDPQLRALADTLSNRGVSNRAISVSAAYHHPGWELAARQWAAEVDRIPAGQCRIPFYSAYVGDLVDGDQLSSATFWTDQLTQPVRFAQATDSLLASESFVFLEVGPRRTLTDLIRRRTTDPDVRAVSSLTGGGSDHTDLLAAAAALWTVGATIDWYAAGQPRPAVRVAMPGYPYQRSRHWVDPPEPEPAAAEKAANQGRDGSGALPAAALEPPQTPTGAGGPGKVELNGMDGAVTEVQWVASAAAGSVAPSPDTRSVSHALLVPMTGSGAPEVVRLALQRAGYRPVLVPTESRLTPGDASRAQPDVPADLERRLSNLALTEGVPDLIVVTCGPDGGQARHTAAQRLDDYFLILSALCRQVITLRHWPVSPRLVLVTQGAVDVSGAEPTDPAVAALPALLRTAAAECPELTCATIDIDAKTQVEALVGELTGRAAGELTENALRMVALRGRRSWMPVERPAILPAGLPRAIREEGVYLLTGGLGGLGLAVANWLAGTGLCPTLLLLSRSPATAATAAALEQLRGLGAQVHAYQCDITDRASLDRIVDEATDRWGPVNGVFHLAGVAGDRMIAFQQPSAGTNVLAPKTHGMLCLETVFKDRPRLDFAVFFSSRAAAEGLVGGGDYAVANAFLDAATPSSPLAGGRALSIGWPIWRGPGMANRSGVDIGQLGTQVRELAGVGAARSPNGGGSVANAGGETTHANGKTAHEPVLVSERELSPVTDWALDEHRLGPVPLLPGSVFVDTVVQMYRQQILGAASAAVEISELVFQAPFMDRRPRLLRLALRPTRSGHETVISSRPAAEPTAQWVVHATGMVGPHAGTAADPVDLSGLLDRFTAAGERARSQPTKPLFTFGPRWHNVAESWVVGSEALLRLELPRPYHQDLAQHALHPALLDTATAAVRGPGQLASVPFLYRGAVFYHDLPARFYAHARRDDSAPGDTPTGELRLIGEDGSILATIDGFVMRMADPESLRGSAASLDRGRSQAPASGRQAGSGGADNTRGSAGSDDSDGLAPATGAALLAALLQAGASGTVLVRPFAEGNPVPVAESPASTQGPPISEQAAPESGTARAPATPPSILTAPGAARPKSLDERLREVWLQTLGGTEVDSDDDFFDVGGNSLSALELMGRLREVLGTDLRIGLLLETRTFGRLVDALREREVV